MQENPFRSPADVDSQSRRRAARKSTAFGLLLVVVFAYEVWLEGVSKPCFDS